MDLQTALSSEGPQGAPIPAADEFVGAPLKSLPLGPFEGPAGAFSPLKKARWPLLSKKLSVCVSPAATAGYLQKSL